VTPAEALNLLTHAAAERIADARAAGQPLTADLLNLNVTEAQRVLSEAIMPRPAVVAGNPDKSPCG
jgi:hypothetical protein